MADGQSKA